MRACMCVHTYTCNSDTIGNARGGVTVMAMAVVVYVRSILQDFHRDAGVGNQHKAGRRSHIFRPYFIFECPRGEYSARLCFKRIQPRASANTGERYARTQRSGGWAFFPRAPGVIRHSGTIVHRYNGEISLPTRLRSRPAAWNRVCCAAIPLHHVTHVSARGVTRTTLSSRRKCPRDFDVIIFHVARAGPLSNVSPSLCCLSVRTVAGRELCRYYLSRIFAIRANAPSGF